MAMATRRSKRQQKRSPDPDAPPPSPPRCVKGAKKGAAGPSVPKDRSARSKNDASLSLTQLVKIVPVPAPAAKRKQVEAGADSEDDHVNKKARQTADSDDERPAPAPLRDTAEVGGDSQDTHVDKDSRHDTGDIQDEEGDIQDEEGDVQDADEANAGTAHQSEGSGGTVSVKEQKLQKLAKNPLLLSLQPPPQQQQVPVNATSKYQYRVSNGLVFSLQQQQTMDGCHHGHSRGGRSRLKEEYLQDVAKPKGKGKAAAVELSDGEEDPFPVASDDDEDKDKDKDKTPNGHITPWAVGPGALSSAHLKEARAARAAYHATLEDIARRAGKKMSTIFKAIGDYPKSVRDTNSWNATRGRRRNRKPTKKYEKRATTPCLLRCLTNERRDPEARRLCVAPLMKWHREKTMQVVDNRKADGGGKVLMNKAVAPLIHQSTAVSNSLDIEVFGLALDCFGDNAIIWGGGTLFQEVFKQHPLPIRKFLIDMKGLFQTTSLYLRNQAETAAAPSMMQPVPITFTRFAYGASERECSTSTTHSLVCIFLAGLVMIERGELELEKIKTTFQKMSWKWANDACKHQLRIENWPAALKETYPGPGFSLGVIREGQQEGGEARGWTPSRLCLTP
ncbi:hypothetical protein B0H14DRAFT_2627877 [Mycena olivaceomarginata]|nr:hypothetical protein B0H14DRAFT_2627877 [Mycena olivaceomarginata]